MKLVENKVNVETSAMKVVTMTIKATQKSFEELAGLYSNRIAAIVRELSTNAFDAHVAAGKKSVPFEVHLPNEMEPYFSVKDNGVGLSEEQIFDNYSRFFDSNKTESNDFVGALGLGSKSPLYYCQSFTIESRYNGKLKVYSAFIGSDGCPKVGLMAETECEDCNGIEVRVPVCISDFQKFRNEAVNIYRWFEVKPMVNEEIEYATITPIKSIDNVEFYEERDNIIDKHGVIMGNVFYPMNVGPYVSNSQVKVNSTVFHFLSYTRYKIVVRVNIGDVQFTINREQLKYNDATQEFLSKLLNEKFAAWQKEELDKIASQPSYYEAQVYFSRDFKYLNELCDKKARWNGQPVKGIVDLSFLQEAKGQEIITATIDKNDRMKLKNGNNDFFNYKHVAFYLPEKETHWKMKVKKYLKDNNFEKGFVFIGEACLPLMQVLDITNHVINVNSLPKVRINRTVGNSTGPRGIKIIGKNGPSFIHNTKDLFDKGGVFIKMSKNQYTINGKHVTQETVKSLLVCLQNFNINLVMACFGKNTKYNPTKWVSLEDYCAKLDKNKLLEPVLYRAYDNTDLPNRGEYKAVHTRLSSLTKPTGRCDYNHLKNYFDMMNIPLEESYKPIQEELSKLEKMESEFATKYPMLHLLIEQGIVNRIASNHIEKYMDCCK